MGFSDHFPRWQLGLRPGFASGGARRVVLEVLLRATGEVRVVLQAENPQGMDGKIWESHGFGYGKLEKNMGYLRIGSFWDT